MHQSFSSKIFRKILLGILMLFAVGVNAQDKMILRAKPDTLLVKVLEMGVNEIKYRIYPVDTTMPIMVENKDRIRRIIFSNGTIMKFAADEFSNAENYASQKKMAVKLDFFSPIRKSLIGSFEYSIKPGLSAEVGLGVIGLGKFDSEILSFEESNGGFIRLGLKFINQPDYYMKGMRYTHILKGGYIKPELLFLYHENTGISNYNWWSSYSGSVTERKIKVNGYAFFMNFGKQWVYSDIFCVDFFIGPGIGRKKVTYINNGNTIPERYLNGSDTGMFGFTAFTEYSNKLSFCMQAGLKIGILIGAKEKE